MTNLRAMLPLAATAAFFILISAVCYLLSANGRLESDNTALSAELKTAKSTIKEMSASQLQVAEMDKRLTEELVNAKNTITQLERDVADGKRRLYVNAKCPASTATGLDDATTARLADSAQRDYFTLRERIETITKQLTGLQEYVREQCIKE
ncbi:lysis protein [Leminorella grimontii]|uniref:lysis protein n=1 Tax=Leminorella grimontii TaxID=82981 RepID=UPI0020858FDD|nr:lysis protein [Leminorella grimontii]GKX60660.1 endopeptidase [Leminorella grimontii]